MPQGTGSSRRAAGHPSNGKRQSRNGSRGRSFLLCEKKKDADAEPGWQPNFSGKFGKAGIREEKHLRIESALALPYDVRSQQTAKPSSPSTFVVCSTKRPPRSKAATSKEPLRASTGIEEGYPEEAQQQFTDKSNMLQKEKLPDPQQLNQENQQEQYQPPSSGLSREARKSCTLMSGVRQETWTAKGNNKEERSQEIRAVQKLHVVSERGQRPPLPKRLWRHQPQRQCSVGHNRRLPLGAWHDSCRHYQGYFEAWEYSSNYYELCRCLMANSVLHPAPEAHVPIDHYTVQWQVPQFAKALQLLAEQEHYLSKGHTSLLGALRRTGGSESKHSNALGFFDRTGLWIPHGMEEFHDKRRPQAMKETAIRREQFWEACIATAKEGLPLAANASPVTATSCSSNAAAVQLVEAEEKKDADVSTCFENVDPPPGFEPVPLGWEKGPKYSIDRLSQPSPSIESARTFCQSFGRPLNIFLDEFEYARALWKRLAGKLRHKLIVMREQKKQTKHNQQQGGKPERAAAIIQVAEGLDKEVLRHTSGDASGGWPQQISAMPIDPPATAAATVAAGNKNEALETESNAILSPKVKPTLAPMMLDTIYKAPWRYRGPTSHQTASEFELDESLHWEQWQQRHQQELLLRYLGGTNQKTYDSLVSAHSSTLELTKNEVQYVHLMYYGCLIEQQCKQQIADLLKVRHGLSRTPISGALCSDRLRNPRQEQQEERRKSTRKQRLQNQLTWLQVVRQKYRLQLKTRRESLLQAVMREHS